MKPTLLILAAGMASRYGSMKQTEGFGPTGETIMDYSIYDAINAGFGKVVFIIRKDFADNFKSQFDKKLKGRIEVDYVFQELNSFVDNPEFAENRTKPWGTGHAILCAKDVIKEPFAVINADDYYGPDAFKRAADFLVSQCNISTYAIIGYRLDTTLSEHGTVSRGVCVVDASGNLTSITERTKIYRDDNKVLFDDNGITTEVSGESSVSMNFWCFHPGVFEKSHQLFGSFVKENHQNPKSEFFIPIIAEAFISQDGNHIKVIPTTSTWFGVTYKEDADAVKRNIDELIANNTYPSTLWA